MIRFEDDAFDVVLTDASFSPPAGLDELVAESIRVAKPGARIAIVIPTAGSFGEIFSLLWEVLFNEDLGEHGAAAEKMIRDLPTVSRAEEIAEAGGLTNIKTHIATEVFDYENGTEFIDSPLVADFLLPGWLDTLNEEEKDRVRRKLAELIDVEDGNLTFRFTVKAALLTGEKVR
jgi:SAM-dependent methyltransferase